MKKRIPKKGDKRMTPSLAAVAENLPEWAGTTEHQRRWVHAYLRTGNLEQASREVSPDVSDFRAHALGMMRVPRVREYYRACIATELQDCDIFFVVRRLRHEATEENNTGGERISALKIMAEAAGLIGKEGLRDEEGRIARRPDGTPRASLQTLTRAQLESMPIDDLERLYDQHGPTVEVVTPEVRDVILEKVSDG